MNCEKCGDTGWAEIMGDGPNFEWDVIDVRPCGRCWLGDAVSEEIKDNPRRYRTLNEREAITERARKGLLEDRYGHDCHAQGGDDGCDHPSHLDHDPAFGSWEEEEAERLAIEDEETPDYKHSVKEH